MTGRVSRGALLALGFIVFSVLFASSSNAQDPRWAEERSIGRADAPVTVVEYFSLTCGHCGNFHNNVLPELVAAYVDTGKIRIVFRDFPLDRVAFHAAVISRCFDGDGYYTYLKSLFERQDEWTTVSNPVVTAAKIAESQGLSMDEIQACLADEELGTWVLQSRQDGDEKFDVSATPSFVIDGHTYSGAPTVAQFSEILDPLLN